MNVAYITLLISIIFSRKISLGSKKAIIRRLVKENKSIEYIKNVDDYKKLNNLFCTAMFYRAYDVFTSSIYALLVSNAVSLAALLRAQVENQALTDYIRKNPSKLKSVFSEKVEISNFISAMDNKGVHGKRYGYLSDITHPFPDGLRICFDTVNIEDILKHKFGDKKLDAQSILKNHNDKIPKDFLPGLVSGIIEHFDSVKNNLNRINEIEDGYELKEHQDYLETFFY